MRSLLRVRSGQRDCLSTQLNWKSQNLSNLQTRRSRYQQASSLKNLNPKLLLSGRKNELCLTLEYGCCHSDEHFANQIHVFIQDLTRESYQFAQDLQKQVWQYTTAIISSFEILLLFRTSALIVTVIQDGDSMHICLSALPLGLEITSLKPNCPQPMRRVMLKTTSCQRLLQG